MSVKYCSGIEPDLSSGINDSKKVDIAKLTWILKGIDLFKARRRKRYDRKMSL